MSLRVRRDGTILCAAIHPELEGDTYIDDNLHYELSVVHKVIVTAPVDKHKLNGQWRWKNSVPANVEIDTFYKEN